MVGLGSKHPETRDRPSETLGPDFSAVPLGFLEKTRLTDPATGSHTFALPTLFLPRNECKLSVVYLVLSKYFWFISISQNKTSQFDTDQNKVRWLKDRI